MNKQGIVSVKKNGKVVLKFIAGTNGGNATRIAKLIRQRGEVPSLDEAYQLAKSMEFGGEQDRVVMDEVRLIYHGVEMLPDRFRATFANPRFNPRWGVGSADVTEIVEL